MSEFARVRHEASTFLRFCLVGAVGFLVDAGVLVLCVEWLQAGPVLARWISAPTAILATFVLNRLWAFEEGRSAPLFPSFVSYCAVQGMGFLLNLAIYTVLVALAWGFLSRPLPALAIASGVALAFNFIGIKRFAFKSRRGVENVIARRMLLSVVCWMAGLFLLMWPGFVNKSPFLFFDTAHYVEIGRSVAARLPGFRLLEPLRTNVADGPVVDAVPDEMRDHPSLSYVGGRSPFYSLFTYVTTRIGGLTLLWLLQTSFAAWLLWRLAQLLAPFDEGKRYLSIVIAGTLMTSLPFYTAMAMPDVFGGLGLLAVGLLVFGSSRQSRAQNILFAIGGAFSFAAHGTNPFVGLVMLGSAILVAFAFSNLDRRSVLKAGLMGLLPIVIAVAMGFSFTLAVRFLTGATPKNPPYMMARVLADGPGRAYLSEACADGESYTLCKFKDRTFRTQDEFLWSGDPSVGVFSLVDYETRTALQEEEMRFVANSIRLFPLAQLKASLTNFLGQLAHFGVAYEFETAALSWDMMNFRQFLPRDEESYKNGLAYRGKFPFAPFDLVQIVAVIASLLYLGYRLSRPDVRHALKIGVPDERSAFAVIAAALIASLVFNAAICGVFSGVNDRYQARIIWLLPLLGFAVCTRLGWRSARKEG